MSQSLQETGKMGKGMGNSMDKQKQEQVQQQKKRNQFNSITQKTTPENQNQTHNVRKEGIQPINQKK